MCLIDTAGIMMKGLWDAAGKENPGGAGKIRFGYINIVLSWYKQF